MILFPICQNGSSELSPNLCPAMTTVFITHELSSPVAVPSQQSRQKCFVHMLDHERMHQHDHVCQGLVCCCQVWSTCALERTSVLLHDTVTSGCHTQEALPGLLKETHITAMVQGNFTAPEAFEMASSVREMLSDGIMTASERSVDRVAVLPAGTTLHK